MRIETGAGHSIASADQRPGGCSGHTPPGGLAVEVVVNLLKLPLKSHDESEGHDVAGAVVPHLGKLVHEADQM